MGHVKSQIISKYHSLMLPMKSSPHCNAPIKFQMFKFKPILFQTRSVPTKSNCLAFRRSYLIPLRTQVTPKHMTMTKCQSVSKCHFCVCTLRFYYWLCNLPLPQLLHSASVAGPQRMCTKSMFIGDMIDMLLCRKSTKINQNLGSESTAAKLFAQPALCQEMFSCQNALDLLWLHGVPLLLSIQQGSAS